MSSKKVLQGEKETVYTKAPSYSIPHSKQVVGDERLGGAHKTLSKPEFEEGILKSEDVSSKDTYRRAIPDFNISAESYAEEGEFLF